MLLLIAKIKVLGIVRKNKGENQIIVILPIPCLPTGLLALK
jgi:hypothetical protein